MGGGCYIKKMVFNIQRNSKNIDRAIYDFSLVKFLVEEELKLRHDNWESFLIRNHFKEMSEDEENSGSKRKRKRGRVLFSNPNPTNENTRVEKVLVQDTKQIILIEPEDQTVLEAEDVLEDYEIVTLDPIKKGQSSKSKYERYNKRSK